MAYSVNFANYTIGETAYEAVAEVCRPFGKRIFLIGGKLAMQAGKEKLESQIKGSELSIVREKNVLMQGWMSWQKRQKHLRQT